MGDGGALTADDEVDMVENFMVLPRGHTGQSVSTTARARRSQGDRDGDDECD